MPLATKNGSLIVKDGQIAENCDCCGGWYCYCEQSSCDLATILGLAPTACLSATITGVSGNEGYLLDGGMLGGNQFKPGIALNQTLILSRDAVANGSTPFSFSNYGAGFRDRASSFRVMRIYEERWPELAQPEVNVLWLEINDVYAGGRTPAYGLHPIRAVKAINACDAVGSQPFSVTFDAADGDFGSTPSLLGGVSPPSNKWMQRYFQHPTNDPGGAFNAEYYWGYNFRNAKVTVTVTNNACTTPTDQRSWWFATPYGAGGSVNQPPATIRVTLVSNGGTADRYAGAYDLELGKTSFLGFDGSVNIVESHGSFYGKTVANKGTFYITGGVLATYGVTVDARPYLFNVAGTPSVSWGISVNQSPKNSGWYGGDAFGLTTPVPWGANTSGTLTGTVTVANYIGGGTLSATVEL